MYHQERRLRLVTARRIFPLFDLCGYRVALNHSEPYVKARAKHVVPGKEGEGLIDAIEYIALNYFGERTSIDISAPN